MAGYKGYEIDYRDGAAGWIVSPRGERIVQFTSVKGRSMPLLMGKIVGLNVEKDYQTLGAALQDIGDQHRALTGDGREDSLLSPGEARVVISGTVKNLQFNQNSIGLQITPTQVEDINREIDKASPGLLKKVLKEWIPQAGTNESVRTLLGMLGLSIS